MSTVKRAFTTIGLNAVETAVVKGTFEDDDKPKIKHIRTICDYVELELAGSGYNTSSSSFTKINLTEMFRKRVQDTSWRVVQKVCILIHTLFRECDLSFMDEFARNGDNRVFSIVKSFIDNSSNNSIVHSTFTRKYAKYLSDKLSVYKELKFNVERKLLQNNKDFFKNYDVQTLGKILPRIMAQLARLIELMPKLETSTFKVHTLDHESMLLLIKDSLRIYTSIQLCLWELLCSFQKLSLEQAKWVSRIYEKYFNLNHRYKEWFDNAVKLGIVSHQYAPKFNTLPASLADKLKQYISEQEKVKKKKKRKKKKKKNNNYDDDDDNDDNNDKYSNHQVGNLEDVIDADNLDKFSQSVREYENSKKINKPKPNKTKKKKKIKKNDDNDNNNDKSNKINKNDQVIDLLGFDMFSQNNNVAQPISVNPDDTKLNGSVNFLNSLNLKTPDAVTDDQFQWSNWGTLGDNNTNTQNINTNTNNNINNNIDNDDWWSTPTNNASNNNNVNVNNNMNVNNSNNNNNNINNNNTAFSSFVNNYNTPNTNTNNNDNVGLSGNTARVLKKKQPNNADPFMDLLNFN